MLGWIWEQGGFLKASPHRQLGIVNTNTDDIQTTKDMRNWIGLFKTLHIVTPKIADILSPFEAERAGRDSKEPFKWTYELEILFKKQKSM